jgi:hypothetical protein
MRFIRYQPSETDKTQSRDPSGCSVECCERRVFQSSLPDLIRQSMQRIRSLSLSVPPHAPDVTMDRRVKPGGDDHRGLYNSIYVTRSLSCHARTCCGHPRLCSPQESKTWMAGTRPAMTIGACHRAGHFGPDPLAPPGLHQSKPINLQNSSTSARGERKLFAGWPWSP